MPRKITRSLWKMQRPGARRKSLTISCAIVQMRMKFWGAIEVVENKIPKLKKQFESDLKQQSGGQTSGPCPLCVVGELARVWCVRAELRCITVYRFCNLIFQNCLPRQCAICNLQFVFEASLIC